MPYKNFFEILDAIPPHYSLSNHQIKVRFYCCDMHNGFVSVAREIFPHSIIYIDMFHVIKHLNDCVSEIRRQIQHDLEPSDPDYRLLKGSMRMLVTKQSGIDTKYDQKAPVVKKRAISC
ncbi:transposase [Jutongia sp.]|uniref:transposase n=1 Tax=Jutongia sp. TaxID=2944204 RepID=UPI003079D5E2